MRTFGGAIASAILVLAHTAAAADDFTQAVDKITPSVATVISTVGPDGGAGRVSCVTAGIVISTDGLILTSCHAAAGFDTVIVRLSDGQTHPAAVHGYHAPSGLALLKIDARGLTAAEFADSDELRVGQWVTSVGNQFGIEEGTSPGFSAGIIGGLKCRVPYTEAYHRELIKTDAAMNFGCIGGPLVDRQGRVVGVNIAICSSTGAWQGVGYAIPSNIVPRVLEKLKAGEKIERGWLGVTIQHGQIARIASVGAGTPAQKAGLRKDDVIVAYNGKNVADAYDLLELVASTSPGSSAVVTIIRNDKRQDITLQVGTRPYALPRQPPVQGTAPDRSDSVHEKPTPDLPRDIKEKFEKAGRAVRDGITHYLADLKDPELIARYSRILEQIPGIELRVISPEELEQLREENRDLRKRIEELERLVRDRQRPP